MVCVYCGSKTDITNSRPQRRSNTVWRRRHCLQCTRTVTTIEQIDYEKSWTVQTNERALTPFLRDKLFISVYKSLGHRTTAANDAIGLTATIMNNLQRTTTEGFVNSQSITTIAYQTLRRFDTAAATTYKAYHSGSL